jgi:hypothetical protein
VVFTKFSCGVGLPTQSNHCVVWLHERGAGVTPTTSSFICIIIMHMAKTITLLLHYNIMDLCKEKFTRISTGESEQGV